MNSLQIAGGIISIAGTITMFFGAYYQGLSQQEFQDGVGDFVDNQMASEVPELVALRVVGKNPNYTLLVKNIGKKPAHKVKLIFTDESTPDAFAGNLISGAREILNGVEYELPLNLFTGINRIIKTTNSVPGYKEKLEDSLKKFASGTIAFIPRFHLEYYFENTKMISPSYFLMVEHKKGIIYLGKDE